MFYLSIRSFTRSLARLFVCCLLLFVVVVVVAVVVVVVVVTVIANALACRPRS